MDYNAWRHFVNEVREKETEHRRTFIGPAYPSLSIGVSDRIAFELFNKVEQLEARVADVEAGLAHALPASPSAPSEGPINDPESTESTFVEQEQQS